MAKPTLRNLTMGGPGHDGYAYNADVYCVRCGRDIVNWLWAKGFCDRSPPSEDQAQDSERWPQPIFFGESDHAQHCGECGEYLYGPQGE